MAKSFRFLQGHPKPAFFEKVQRGDQRKFFKNRPRIRACLKCPKGFWLKWHYRLFSMRLKTKDCERFWRKKRLKECPNCQVMEIFAWSPKTRIFWKSLKGDQGKFFKNRPESSPDLKGPKALWRKPYYPLISMRLKWKDWKTFWRKQRLQMCQNSQVMAIFARSPKTRIFWKSANGGPREIFKKSPKKTPSLKRPKSTLAQMALFFNYYALKLERPDKIKAQKAAQKGPEWWSYANLWKVTQNLHFQKKCKGETKRSFSKIAQKSSSSLPKTNSTLAQMTLSSN